MRPNGLSPAIAAGVLVLAACTASDDDVGDGSVDADAVAGDGGAVDESALQELLDEWRSEVGAFGATLSIRQPGNGDIHLASGVDDREPETAMPTDGTFAAASVVKTFVAAAALQLVDESRLSLDEPVDQWLPELPRADEITLAMLLDHTAGLGEWDEVDTILEDLTRSFAPEEVLAEHVAAAQPRAPGERFVYSNANYTAMGLLVERLQGDDLNTVIAERFTEPLGLEETMLSDGSTLPTRHAWFTMPGSTDRNRQSDALDYPHEAQMTTLWAAGNLISSSSDLLDWGEALYSGEVLSADSTAAMLEMRNSFALNSAIDMLVATDEATPLHYGLGAMGFCLDGAGCASGEVEVVGHSGQLGAGSRVLLAHHTDSGTTLVFHANVGDIDLPQLIAPLGTVFAQLGLG